MKSWSSANRRSERRGHLTSYAGFYSVNINISKVLVTKGTRNVGGACFTVELFCGNFRLCHILTGEILQRRGTCLSVTARRSKLDRRNQLTQERLGANLLSMHASSPKDSMLVDYCAAMTATLFLSA